MTFLRALLAVALMVATAAAAPAADVLLMRNGDRVSGRIVGETSRSIRIETPYGRLLIPRGTIERIQREGKPVEILNPPAAGASAMPTPARGVRLVVVVLGQLYAGKGLRSRAVTTLRRALELQPDFPDAAAALSELGPDDPQGPPDQDSGFLKKIFGKR